MEGERRGYRLKASSLMDLFNRALSRQEVKCQALPPGREKGSAGSLQIARDTPHTNPGTAKKTLTTPGYWDRVNPPAWKSQLTTAFTYATVQHCSLDMRQATLYLREQASAVSCWSWQTLTGMLEEKGPKRSNLQFPSSSPPGKGVQSEVESHQDRCLGTSHHIYPALEYPLKDVH